MFKLSQTSTTGPAELLVSGIRQVGVVGLGETLASVFGGAAVYMDAIEISRGRWPALVQINAAIETRLVPAAVTFTSGVRPRRPQVRPLGGLRP
ncbi:hypothetical protein [Streptomyces sp. NPDC059215]|uniref:hypothetical protein n=1 Tax=Streptomyces sp. NPDC059215 TaxID=3346772 RepID=UPI003684F9BD